MTVPMPVAHQNFIANSSAQCRILLQISGMMNQLNTLWAGPPDYRGLITQEEIDSVPGYVGAGLTVQNLTDAEYALSQLLVGINNAIVSFTVMSSLP